MWYLLFNQNNCFFFKISGYQKDKKLKMKKGIILLSRHYIFYHKNYTHHASLERLPGKK